MEEYLHWKYKNVVTDSCLKMEGIVKWRGLISQGQLYSTWPHQQLHVGQCRINLPDPLTYRQKSPLYILLRDILNIHTTAETFCLRLKSWSLEMTQLSMNMHDFNCYYHHSGHKIFPLGHKACAYKKFVIICRFGGGEGVRYPQNSLVWQL